MGVVLLKVFLFSVPVCVCVSVCVCVCVCASLAAEKKGKLTAQKKAHKLYEKLGEEEEQCKSKLASCETRDVRARQVSQ